MLEYFYDWKKKKWDEHYPKQHREDHKTVMMIQYRINELERSLELNFIDKWNIINRNIQRSVTTVNLILLFIWLVDVTSINERKFTSNFVLNSSTNLFHCHPLTYIKPIALHIIMLIGNLPFVINPAVLVSSINTWFAKIQTKKICQI